MEGRDGERIVVSQRKDAEITMFPTIDKESTGMNLKKLMDQRGLIVKDIQKYLHLGSVQSIYHWLNGTCLPSLDNLYALSQLFQVPMDDIICGNRRIIPAEMSSQCKRIYTYYTKLNDLLAA